MKSGVTFVFPEPDEDWRPPAACSIATPGEWALQGFACKEQVRRLLVSGAGLRLY